jgi:FolB domain-containing protein
VNFCEAGQREKFLGPSMWPRPLRRILLSLHPTKPKTSKGVFGKRYAASPPLLVRPRVIMPSVHKFTPDRIFIENLQLKCVCGPDAFKCLKPQPINLSLDVGTSIARAAASDKVELSVDYSELYKALLKLEASKFAGVQELMDRVAGLAAEEEGVGSVNVRAELDRGILGAEKVIWMLKVVGGDRESRVAVKGVQVMIIVGINENLHERTMPQPVLFDVEWELSPGTREFKLQDIISSIVKV